MKLNVYSIYDVATGAYMRPFFMQSDGQAIRAFKDIATDKDHEIGSHPEDYTLVRIGVFDDNKGQIHPEDVESLATALEMVGQSRNIKPGALKEFDDAVSNGSFVQPSTEG